MGILNLDLVIFGSLVFVYNKLKQVKPDLFFLAKGTSVFLPPDEKDVKDVRKEQEKLSKKKGKQPLMPVKMIKATYEFFSKYKYMVELDIIIMLLVCYTGQLIISELVRHFILKQFESQGVEREMNFGFALGLSILLLMITYYCKSAKITGWKSSDVKTAFWVSVLTSLMVLIIFVGFKDIIDIDLEKAVSLQQKHLEFVLSPQQKSNSSNKGGILLSIEVFQLGCIFLNAIVTFSTVATVIRFSGCYSSNLNQTLQLTQKEQEEEEQTQEEKDKQEQEQNNKNKLDSTFVSALEEREENLEKGVQKQTNLTLKNHKKNMLLFNISLVINLISVVLWIKPVVNMILKQFNNDQDIINFYLPIIRLCLIILQSIIVFFTLKYQVQMFMFKSFDYLKSLTNDNSEIAYQAVKSKTSAYVQSMVFVSFQIFLSIAIPVLLASLIFYRIYVSPSNPIPSQENVAASDNIVDYGSFVEEQTAIMKLIYQNIKLYSIFNNYFVNATLSFWLFNYQLISYVLKIIFIILSRQSQGI